MQTGTTLIMTSVWMLGSLSLDVATLRATSPRAKNVPSVKGQDPQARNAPSRAIELFKQALAADAAGDAQLRQELLKEAIQAAPDWELPRWFSGQVRFQGKWRPHEYVAHRVAHDPRWKEYRALRGASDNGLKAHVELARWCHREGLQDEEKLHWQQVLQWDPEHRAALGSLGVVRYGDGFYTPAEIKFFQLQQTQQQQATKRYRRTLKRWLSQARRGSDTLQQEALSQLAQIDDPLAVTALINVLAAAHKNVSASSTSAPKSFDKRFCLAIVATLEKIQQHPATLGLLNIALNATDDDLRLSAARALRGRDATSYIPMLMANLIAPLNTTYSLNISPGGHVSLVQDLEQEHPRGVVREVYSNDFSTNQVFMDRRPASKRSGEAMRVSRDPYSNAVNVLESRLDKVVQHNRARAESNARIIELLQVVTSKNLGDHPRAWWEDWHLYNELGDYEVSFEEDYYRDVYAPDITEIRQSHSCFVAGTPVWTRLGTVAIEEIRVGDLVLSQSPTTGRLEYRPVLETTASTPMAVRKLVFEDETITTTPGHRFWVSGEGWRMAKFLKSNERLLSMQGSLKLFSTEVADEAEVYNLVVSKYHTYFVGSSRLLVHDINCPQPLAMALPGVPE